jgi:hypothetical protein
MTSSFNVPYSYFCRKHTNHIHPSLLSEFSPPPPTSISLLTWPVLHSWNL